eukprot:GHVO01044840.1.p1 GENE.GHVO01044840.1~~GHVO01044840.1.p1  ORF type:complete len:202 (+),score=27.29 GHVO01044840.1:251-856(+)
MRVLSLALGVVVAKRGNDDQFYQGFESLVSQFNSGLQQPVPTQKLIEFANGFIGLIPKSPSILAHPPQRASPIVHVAPACGLGERLSVFSFTTAEPGESCAASCATDNLPCEEEEQLLMDLNYGVCTCVTQREDSSNLDPTIIYDSDLPPGCYTHEHESNTNYFNAVQKKAKPAPGSIGCSAEVPFDPFGREKLCVCGEIL